VPASIISRRGSFRAECRGWYERREQLGILTGAGAYVYAWHEENEPGECKIGHCRKDPFEYLWDGNALSHQKRLPVIFLTIGTRSTEDAQRLENELHRLLEEKHMPRSCCREWFAAHRDDVSANAKVVLATLGANAI
jgi:hypothetical protein